MLGLLMSLFELVSVKDPKKQFSLHRTKRNYFFSVKLEPSSNVGRLEPMTEVVIKPKLREEEEPVLPHGSGSVTDEVLLGDGFSKLVNLPLPYEHLIVRLAPHPGISFYKIPFMIITLDLSCIVPK